MHDVLNKLKEQIAAIIVSKKVIMYTGSILPGYRAVDL